MFELELQLSPWQRAFVEDQAASRGLTVSQYIEKLLAEDMKRDAEEVRPQLIVNN